MNEPLPLGAHLVTPRRWYSHHGIYVGNGRVVHYAGYCKGLLHRGPVEEVSLEEFTRGHGYGIRDHADGAPFEAREVARRARDRLGETGYSVFGNNCEHFCEWCTTGRIRSPQVDDALQHPLAFLRRLLGFGGTRARAAA